MSQKSDYLNLMREQLLEIAIGSLLSEINDYAKEAGFRVRQTKINGIAQLCTRDYRLDRINVETRNNIVVKAYVG